MVVQPKTVPFSDEPKRLRGPTAYVIRRAVEQAAVVLVELHAPGIRYGNEQPPVLQQQLRETREQIVEIVHVFQYLEQEYPVELPAQCCIAQILLTSGIILAAKHVDGLIAVFQCRDSGSWHEDVCDLVEEQAEAGADLQNSPRTEAARVKLFDGAPVFPFLGRVGAAMVGEIVELPISGDVGVGKHEAARVAPPDGAEGAAPQVADVRHQPDMALGILFAQHEMLCCILRGQFVIAFQTPGITDRTLHRNFQRAPSAKASR